MSDKVLLSPKKVLVHLQDGEEKEFVISKFPAVDGREIIAAYPVANLPKIGDYGVSKQTMLKLMTYVAVETATGTLLPLTTEALVNNHVPDWEALVKIEMLMLEYNTSFFDHGLLPGLLDRLLEKAAPMLSRILTSSLQALAQVSEQHTSNSETS